MNLGLISLIALLAAIVIGFVRKANVGILCIGFSMILGLVYGIKAGDIIKGYHFFCEKLQSSVFIDDGKQICDTDHLHAEGGTEALDDVSGLDPVDETEDS